MLPERKTLPHQIPSWVQGGSLYFITLCTQPRGQNQICRPEIAEWIRETFAFREDRGDWWVYLLLLMPDHLHAVMSFARNPGMLKSLVQWKRYTAREQGLQWQRDFFDHRLRGDENQAEKALYIRMNPVRSGLVARPEDWPYVWSKGAW